MRNPVLAAFTILTALFLVTFFVVPTSRLVGLSFLSKGGAFSLEQYAKLLSSPIYVEVLFNTIRISVLTTLISSILAYPLAYFVVMRQPATRKFVLFLVLLPFWTSFLIRAFGWMVLLGRHGALNSLAVFLGLPGAPYDLMFNQFSVLLGMVHAMVPIAVLAIYSVLENIDPRLVHAAQTLGARPGTAFWTVYFPLSASGVAAAALLVFISSIGFFVIPALLGSPAEMMIAQMVIFHADEMMDWGFGSAIAVMLLAASTLVIVIFRSLVGGQALFAAASPDAGANGLPANRPLSGIGRRALLLLGRVSDSAVLAVAALVRLLPAPARRPAWALLAGSVPWTVIVFLVVPTVFIVPIAFSATEFIVWPPGPFTLNWFGVVADSPVWQQAALRSCGVALATASLSLILGVPLSIALIRHSIPFKGPFLLLLMTPMIFPHIIIALSLYYFFAKLGLIGTSLGLVIGHTLFALPFVTITLLAVFKHYDWKLDQAAAVSGARPFVALTKVTLPLVRAGVIGGFLLAFVKSFDELTVALFISGGLSTTIPKQMWTEALTQFTPGLAAVSTLFLAFVSVMIFSGEAASKLRR